MKKTEWYPGDVKPARPGVYEREKFTTTSAAVYNYWNGAHWGWPARTPGVAFEGKGHKSMWQEVPWRGLSEPTT